MAVILKKRPPAEIELAEGLTLTVRPAGAADLDLARAAATRRIAAIAAGQAALADYGIEEPGADLAPGGFEEVSAALKVGSALFAIELGVRHIVAWKGVTLDGEADAPTSRGNIAALFNEWAPEIPDVKRHSYGTLFLVKMEGLATLEQASKNASTSAPAINGAAEGNTAGSAGSTETRAPSASA